MKLRAKISVRNEYMLEARAALGMSQKELAKATGIPLFFINSLERLDYSLIKTDYQVRRIAHLADFLELTVIQIAPPEVHGRVLTLDREKIAYMTPDLLIETVERQLQLETAIVDRIALQDAMGAIEDPEHLRKEVENSLHLLPSRERLYISMHFGLCGQSSHTYDKIARKHKISRERVRQIVDRAMGRLRQPRRCHNLMKFIEESDRENFVHGRPVVTKAFGGTLYGREES